MPDRHGTGTNALLLAPPDAIVPAFGPGSFDRHVAAARAAGVAAHVERLPSLALDVDTAGDLAALRAALEQPARRRAAHPPGAGAGRGCGGVSDAAVGGRVGGGGRGGAR